MAWVRLSEEDSVVVLTRDLASGEELRGPAGERWILDAPLAMGHKLAARAIAPGETVFKSRLPDRRCERADRRGRARPHAQPSQCSHSAGAGGRVVNPLPARWPAYERQDGGKGVRNVIAVTYLVECAHHVAREITAPFRERGVHTIGFPGCYPNAYASAMLESLCTHPNVGAVLLRLARLRIVSARGARGSSRAVRAPVKTLVIQQAGGTRKTIEEGQRWVFDQLLALRDAARTTM